MIAINTILNLVTGRRGLLALLFFLFLLLQLIAGRFLAGETIIVTAYLLINLPRWNFTFNPEVLISPVNLAWLVFFVRLYIIPVTAIFWGYDMSRHATVYSETGLFASYLIILISFLAFLAGWEIQSRIIRPSSQRVHHLGKLKVFIISVFFMVSGIVAMLLYFPDLTSYLNNIYVETRMRIENEGINKYIKLFFILSKSIIPVALAGLLTLMSLEKRNKSARYLLISLFALLFIAFTWNENRQTMVYPLLALFAAISNKFIRFRIWPTLLFSMVLLYVLMSFIRVRTSKERSLADNRLETGTFIHMVQTYAGGPVQVAPVFLFKHPEWTIPASFFQSFPVLGAPFRNNSGLEQYNYKVYKRQGMQDMVFPVAAETYLNGGILLLVILLIITGYFYSLFNSRFEASQDADLLYRYALFYLILLYNATILQSYQVAGQFLFYYSLPPLIIMWVYYREKQKSIPAAFASFSNRSVS